MKRWAFGSSITDINGWNYDKLKEKNKCSQPYNWFLTQLNPIASYISFLSSFFLSQIYSEQFLI